MSEPNSITARLPETAEIESRLAEALREVTVLKKLLRIARQAEAQAKRGDK